MNAAKAGAISHLTDGWAKPTRAKNAMGKEEFLKLLVTQLRNQDPLKPMEHNEFIAQLAQFSSLEQLHNIGSGVEKLHGGLGEEAKLQALGMIGKRIEADGDQLELTEGQPISISHSLKEGSRPVRATIFDKAGRLVRKIDLSGMSPDSKEIVWDGKSEEGDVLPSGKYTFRVLGLDKSGRAEESGTDIDGRVTGVKLDGQTPILTVENDKGVSRQVKMGRVRRISLESTPEKQSKGTPVPITNPNGPAGHDVAKLNVEPDATKPNNLERGWRRFPEPLGGMKR